VRSGWNANRQATCTVLYQNKFEKQRILLAFIIRIYQDARYYECQIYRYIRDNVRNEEVLLRFKEHRNILHEIRKRKANWIGQILRRNCLLQRVIEGKIKGGIEVTGRRGRKRRKLLDDLKERTGYSQLEEALDSTVWRARFGRGFGPVVRQTTK